MKVETNPKKTRQSSNIVGEHQDFRFYLVCDYVRTGCIFLGSPLFVLQNLQPHNQNSGENKDFKREPLE